MSRGNMWTNKYLPQQDPSYLAVMLNVTDSADGFFSTPHAPVAVLVRIPMIQYP